MLIDIKKPELGTLLQGDAFMYCNSVYMVTSRPEGSFPDRVQLVNLENGNLGSLGEASLVTKLEAKVDC